MIKNQPIKFTTSLLWIEKKMNLNINIPTKKIIDNLYIFIYFIINFRKVEAELLPLGTELERTLRNFRKVKGPESATMAN